MKRVKIDPVELKQIQLDILNTIDHFCKEHGLRYSLAYGTLIGAVRHKGFIPWDDDIDIMMPRPDYDRLRKEFICKDLYLVDLAGRDDCVETFVKVYRKGTVMVDKSFGREIWGVNVDVFPIDGAPSNDLHDYYASLEHIREKLFQICPYYKSVRKHKLPLFVKYLVKRIRYFYPGSFRSLKNNLIEGQTRFSYESSDMVGVYYASEKTRTFLPKRVYTDLISLSFEGREYSALSCFDTYLSSLYGEYMELPPEEKRVPNHSYDSFVVY